MLIGRDEELALVVDLVARGMPVVVAGEPGVGKTALIRASAAAASPSGRVAEGGGFASLTWMPFLPIERALGRLLPQADAAWVAAQTAEFCRGGLLIVEDAHWADPGTLEVLRLLMGHVSILTSIRTGDPGTEAVLEALEGFEVVQLEPLSDSDARALALFVHPGLTEYALDGVIRRSGGNPLLVEELAASDDPSETLRLAIAARLRALPADAGRAMRLLALAGRELPVAMCGPGADHLIRVGLATSREKAVALRHALFGELIAAELAPAERASLHAELARALQTADAGAAAHHFAAAGLTQEAFAFATDAAHRARFPAERARHLAVAASCDSGPQADELRFRAVEELLRVNDYDAAEPILDLIDASDPSAAARVLQARATISWQRGDVQAARAQTNAGLEAIDGLDAPIEVALRIDEARYVALLDGDPARGATMLEGVLAAAERHRSRLDEARFWLGSIRLFEQRVDEAEILLREAVEQASAEGDPARQLDYGVALLVLHLETGALVRAIEVTEHMLELARTHHLAMREAKFRAFKLQLDMLGGQYAEAINAGRALMSEPLPIRVRDLGRFHFIQALHLTGEVDEALAQIESALSGTSDDAAGRGSFLYLKAQAELWSGRAARALDTAAAALADPGTASLFGTQLEWLRAWAAVELGQEPDPPSTTEVPPSALGAGVLLEHRALAVLSTDPRAAAALFDEARIRWDSYSVGESVRCAWASAEALRRSGDVSTAKEQLLEVEREARALGMKPLVHRIERSLRALGERRQSQRASAGDGLTARQHEILVLVGAGLTNAEISRRLGIAPSTVKRQIEIATRRLGATSRAQAALLAGP